MGVLVLGAGDCIPKQSEKEVDHLSDKLFGSLLLSILLTRLLSLFYSVYSKAVMFSIPDHFSEIAWQPSAKPLKHYNVRYTIGCFYVNTFAHIMHITTATLLRSLLIAYMMKSPIKKITFQNYILVK